MVGTPRDDDDSALPRRLAKKRRQKEEWAIKEFVPKESKISIGSHRIVVVTPVAAGKLRIAGVRRGHFTHVFIDEAGQTTEPEALIPIEMLNRYSSFLMDFFLT